MPYVMSQFRNSFEIMNLFRYLVKLLGQGISPSQGLYPHKTTQHRKTRTNIHALSEIRTHDPSVRAAEASALNCVATVIGAFLCFEGEVA
jgi:hypothetical protein